MPAPDSQMHKSIVITGGGSGLGEALALQFARQGYKVAVTDVDEQRAIEVLARIQDAGGQGISQRLDVTSPAHWDALYQRILSEWGSVGILVNNAGVAAGGRLEDLGMEDWEWLINIDLMGVVRGCHRFLPLFREQGHGHIVNVSSLAGLLPVPELSAYATAKAAVVALTEQLRVDLHGSPIGVSLLCPAFVQTRLMETFRSHDARHQRQAERWMARSRVSAADVAECVFTAVAEKRFLILTHAESRWALRFRRWFPGLFFHSVVRAAARMADKGVA